MGVRLKKNQAQHSTFPLLRGAGIVLPSGIFIQVAGLVYDGGR